MADVDDVAAILDSMLEKIAKLEPWHDERPLQLQYNPREVGPQRTRESDEGPSDPWHAWTGRLLGTGQTAEMALLDLKAKLETQMRETIAHANARIAEDQARLAEMAAMLTTEKRSPDRE